MCYGIILININNNFINLMVRISTSLMLILCNWKYFLFWLDIVSPCKSLFRLLKVPWHHVEFSNGEDERSLSINRNPHLLPHMRHRQRCRFCNRSFTSNQSYLYYCILSSFFQWLTNYNLLKHQILVENYSASSSRK